MILGVLGDPLAFTLSPVLHRAGLAALGIAGESEALRTPIEMLPARLNELAARGLRGVNLTHPLKEVVLPLLARVSEPARRARSVNTVTFDDGGWTGSTTDGRGFIDLLEERGRELGREHVVLLGGGGASRSLALALADEGATVTVSVRDPRAAEEAFVPIGAWAVEWRSPEEAGALAEATVVVNATPLGGPEGPLAVDQLPAGALIVDLVYGETVTPWILAARARGLTAMDGLGLLVHQARHSLAVWTGRDVPLAALASAVGWPR